MARMCLLVTPICRITTTSLKIANVLIRLVPNRVLPSFKRRFLENSRQTEGICKRWLCVLVYTENILKTDVFEKMTSR